MDKLIFSQSGVYRLSQLASQVHSITGMRHKLSDQSSMMELLRDCATSNHSVIQEHFAAFSSELDSTQVSSLVANGVRPRVSSHTH
ncbi:hypothetical protein NBRC116493_27550 [Aurantivibrio infirmus]